MARQDPRRAAARLHWLGAGLGLIAVVLGGEHRRVFPAAVLLVALYVAGSLGRRRWPLRGNRSVFVPRVALVALLGAAFGFVADLTWPPLLLAACFPLLLENMRGPAAARVLIMLTGPPCIMLPSVLARPTWMGALSDAPWVAMLLIPPALAVIAALIVSDSASARRMARSLVEQQLRALQRQQQERAALGAIAEPVLLIDRDFRVLSANPAAEEIFATELSGRFLRELVRAPEGQEALPTSEPELGTYHVVETYLASGPHRGQRWSLDLRSLPEARDDSTRWVGVLHRSDRMLEQVRLGEERHRRLQESTRSRSEFLRLMSYELRTPLHAILGFAGLLQLKASPPLPAEATERARLIEQTGAHMRGILDDVRDFVRLGETSAPAPQLFDLTHTVQTVVQMLRSSADHKGVTLSLVPPPAGLEAIGDERMTTQILLNLVTNGIQFTPPDGHVTITARRSGERAEVQVEDSGVGIPWSEQARVFEPLSQSRYVAPWKAGSGMGLAIARRLAELQGGTIALHSRPGHGSTFVLRLDTEASTTGADEPLLDQLLVTDDV